MKIISKCFALFISTGIVADIFLIVGALIVGVQNPLREAGGISGIFGGVLTFGIIGVLLGFPFMLLVDYIIPKNRNRYIYASFLAGLLLWVATQFPFSSSSRPLIDSKGSMDGVILGMGLYLVGTALASGFLFQILINILLERKE